MFKKSLFIAGLGFLLLGPIFSFATVVVSCDVVQSAWSGWDNICLPDGGEKVLPNGEVKKGERFSFGMRDISFHGAIFNVMGIGWDFASAVEDARSNCRSMATKINNSKRHGGFAFFLPAEFSCPIHACVVLPVPEPLLPIEGFCGCLRHGDSAKAERGQCVEVGADDGYPVSGPNGRGWFAEGKRICAEVAQETDEVVSVYCGIQGKKTKSNPSLTVNFGKRG